MKSIRQACADFDKKFSKLNFLIMAQGVATMDGRNETKEGIDRKMALHYYGRIMFVNALAPVLTKTALTEDVRVASILSGGVHSPIANLDDLALKRTFSIVNAANACGFYNDLAFDQLARNFGGPAGNRISFVHAAPGFIRTNWGSEFPWYLRSVVRFAQVFARDPQDYGRAFITSLVSPRMGPPVGVEATAGFHLMSASGDEASRTSLHNDTYRAAVWKHTEETLAVALSTKE
jgi:NAD(P)-dependent dehydrogenase (short-subunit alcohol dehydrogenase family)